MAEIDITTQTIAVSKPEKKSARPWFDWHSWLGVLSGLLLFVVCWGGTFATLSHELDWLVNPAQRVAVSGELRSLEDLYEATVNAYPDAQIQAVNAPRYANFAAEVVISDINSPMKRVYIDPYTLEIRGEAPFLNIQRYLRDFHRRLFTGSFGFYLICLASLPLLGSLITSLYFYKRWWRRFFEFKSARTVRSFVSNLHRLSGVWALWFVVIISVTGAWYLFERVRSIYGDEVFAYSDAIPSAVIPIPMLDYESKNAMPFTALLKIAREERPDIEIASVSTNRNGYFYVVGQTDNLMVRNRANKIYLMPNTGEVIYSQYGEDLNPYWYWSNMADPLHFGNFGGLISKLIWFFFGLLLSFLSLSGVWLFAKRLSRNARQKTKAIYTAASLGFVSLWLILNALSPFLAYWRTPASQSLPILPGVSGFLYSWLIITSLICLSWIYLFFTNSKEIATGLSLRFKGVSSDSLNKNIATRGN